MYPKIGIRPTIDGRWGGVRESLEEKTMAMANAAKELIEANVRYQDGTPVECVISPCTIGSGAEAAKCVAEKFDLTFVPLQKLFDEAVADSNAEYWSADGVHPTYAGHQLIKEELVKAIINVG